MKITGIILAGGKSSRMGKDKGLLILNGKPMIKHIINVLKPLVSEIIIISNNPEYKQFGCPVYPDIIKEKGPVGGIYTGLFYSKTETNFILSCDTPFVSSEFLKFLLMSSKNNQITIPKFENKTHPLLGVYKKSTSHFFKESIEKGELKLGLVNKNLNCKTVNVSLNENEVCFNEKIFTNINSKNDLDKIINEN